MRYKVYVVTAAQYIGRLYAALAKGRTFGEAASEARKHLAPNPERWLGPGAAAAAGLVRARRLRGRRPSPCCRPRRAAGLELDDRPELDPVQTRPRAAAATCPTPASSAATRRCCCSTGPSTGIPSCCCTPTPARARPPTAVEFARWYAAHRRPRPAAGRALHLVREPHRLDRRAEPDRPALRAAAAGQRHRVARAERQRRPAQPGRCSSCAWSPCCGSGTTWSRSPASPRGRNPPGRAAEQAELADFLKQIQVDRGTQAEAPAHLPPRRAGVAGRHAAPGGDAAHEPAPTPPAWPCSLGDERQTGPRGRRRLAAAARLLPRATR